MELKQMFRDCLGDSRKLAILGAGSELKADDAAGVKIAGRLLKKYAGACPDRLAVYNGGTAPENLTGAIKAFAPDHLLIIDAADFGEAPGTVAAVQTCAISGVAFSTHMLPLHIMTDYLRRETGCGVTVIGIQPADLTFGAAMTNPVRAAVRRVAGALDAALQELMNRPTA